MSEIKKLKGYISLIEKWRRYVAFPYLIAYCYGDTYTLLVINQLYVVLALSWIFAQIEIWRQRKFNKYIDWKDKNDIWDNQE